MTPLLVDSSAWIGSFSKNPDSNLVSQILSAKKQKRLATCGMIYLEVVRGSRNKTEYGELTEEFHAMHWLPMEEFYWDLAAQIGFHLQKKGLQPPATDLLIAAAAIHHKCQLLHQDKHFEQIARFFPLRLVR